MNKGKIIGHDLGDDKMAEMRKTIKINDDLFVDLESGAIEANTIFNDEMKHNIGYTHEKLEVAGIILFKTSAEMAFFWTYGVERGWKVTQFDGSEWSFDIGDMILGKTESDYMKLRKLIG
jgi:hypothetical protein